MRILFLSTWHPNPPDNGSRIRVYHLLKALGERHEVDLVSFSYGTAQAGLDSGLEDVRKSAASVPINPFEANKAPAYRRFLSTAPVVTRPIGEMQRLVRRLMAEIEFDAIIASGIVMESYALEGPAAIFRSLEEHNSLSRMMQDRYVAEKDSLLRWQYWLSWQKARLYERRSFARFELVTLPSEQDKEYSERLVHDRRTMVSVVPNGMDCTRYKVDSQQIQENSLIFNGSMTYRPNFRAVQYFLSEVYPQVQALIPGVTFRVTGATEGVQLDVLELDPSVELTGYLEDVRSEVASATICVVPLLEGGGTRLKILEAMALGTPVLSTSKGAEGLDVTAGEHLLIADDAQAFARETVRLLKDDVLRSRLADNGRRLVEKHYDWRQIGLAYVGLLERNVKAKRLLASG